MTGDSTQRCAYRECDRPAETSLQWVDEDEPIHYCSIHAENAQAEYPDMVEVVEDG